MEITEKRVAPESGTPIDVPSLYSNGFQVGLSNADINILWMLNNAPSLQLSLSYTTAKTLAGALNEMVDTLEKLTGRQIMTTTDVAAGLEKLNAEDRKDGNVH